MYSEVLTHCGHDSDAYTVIGTLITGPPMSILMHIPVQDFTYVNEILCCPEVIFMEVWCLSFFSLLQINNNKKTSATPEQVETDNMRFWK
jgi:hypothetical protein